MCGIAYLTALLPALLGLPLRADSPYHHQFLAYFVTAALVAASVQCAQQVSRRPKTLRPWVLLAISTPPAFVLDVSAFDAVISHDTPGLRFVAALTTFNPEGVRSMLVLFLAMFVLVATLTFAAGERAASLGSPTTSDGIGSDDNIEQLVSAQQTAPPSAGAPSKGRRSTKSQRNGGDNRSGRSASRPGDVQSRSDSAESDVDLTGHSPSAEERAAAPSAIDRMRPDTVATAEETLSSRRVASVKFWVTLCLALVVPLLALALFWNGQVATAWGCKTSVGHEVEAARQHIVRLQNKTPPLGQLSDP